MAATTALCEALNQAISSGNLVDTKITLYSHRDSSGRACRPKTLYANSHVLRTVPHFDDLLFGNFEESKLKDFGKEEIFDEESATNYGYLSDSDLEDDEDERLTPFKNASKPKVHPFDPFAISGEDSRIFCEEHEERVEKGKIAPIADVAFVTFQAFLLYLYTGTIEFAPFGSNENRRSRSTEIVTPSDDKVPRPSPKSIYRLADKYDVPALKILALDHIRSELTKTKCDIVEEAFSTFTSQYDEIRDLYAHQLASVWMEDSTTEETRVRIEEKIDSFYEGDLEHAADVLSALWEILNKDGDITAPSNTSPAGAQVTSPTHWASVKIALIKSIRKGILFDRKYWVRHSKTGDILKPIYFSSIIMGDKMQKLNTLVKRLKGRKPLTNDMEEYINVESDCEGEGDLAGADEGTPKEEENEETRAVLIAGSFSAWKSLFFYCCTDTISFAPLKSQGIDSRSNHIRENTTTAAPHPCSPKSIYVLASLLGIQPLSDSAFADIKSKVSLDNVVDEVFSWVTACQEKIKEMECELLVSNFKDPKTITLVKESIRHSSDGSSSHRAGALKLGLRKALELKKQARRPPGVLLRCSNSYCGWYSNPVPYSSVGSNTYCPNCRNGYYMRCVECGYDRTSDYPSCRNCGKSFV